MPKLYRPCDERYSDAALNSLFTKPLVGVLMEEVEVPEKELTQLCGEGEGKSGLWGMVKRYTAIGVTKTWQAAMGKFFGGKKAVASAPALTGSMEEDRDELRTEGAMYVKQVASGSGNIADTYTALAKFFNSLRGQVVAHMDESKARMQKGLIHATNVEKKVSDSLPILESLLVSVFQNYVALTDAYDMLNFEVVSPFEMMLFLHSLTLYPIVYGNVSFKPAKGSIVTSVDTAFLRDLVSKGRFTEAIVLADLYHVNLEVDQHRFAREFYKMLETAEPPQAYELLVNLLSPSDTYFSLVPNILRGTPEDDHSYFLLFVKWFVFKERDKNSRIKYMEMLVRLFTSGNPTKPQLRKFYYDLCTVIGCPEISIFVQQHHLTPTASRVVDTLDTRDIYQALNFNVLPEWSYKEDRSLDQEWLTPYTRYPVVVRSSMNLAAKVDSIEKHPHLHAVQLMGMIQSLGYEERKRDPGVRMVDLLQNGSRLPEAVTLVQMMIDECEKSSTSPIVGQMLRYLREDEGGLDKVTFYLGLGAAMDAKLFSKFVGLMTRELTMVRTGEKNAQRYFPSSENNVFAQELTLDYNDISLIKNQETRIELFKAMWSLSVLRNNQTADWENTGPVYHMDFAKERGLVNSSAFNMIEKYALGITRLSWSEWSAHTAAYDSFIGYIESLPYMFTKHQLELLLCPPTLLASVPWLWHVATCRRRYIFPLVVQALIPHMGVMKKTEIIAQAIVVYAASHGYYFRGFGVLDGYLHIDTDTTGQVLSWCQDAMENVLALSGQDKNVTRDSLEAMRKMDVHLDVACDWVWKCMTSGFVNKFDGNVPAMEKPHDYEEFEVTFALARFSLFVYEQAADKRVERGEGQQSVVPLSAMAPEMRSSLYGSDEVANAYLGFQLENRSEKVAKKFLVASKKLDRNDSDLAFIINAADRMSAFLLEHMNSQEKFDGQVIQLVLGVAAHHPWFLVTCAFIPMGVKLLKVLSLASRWMHKFHGVIVMGEAPDDLPKVLSNFHQSHMEGSIVYYEHAVPEEFRDQFSLRGLNSVAYVLTALSFLRMSNGNNVTIEVLSRMQHIHKVQLLNMLALQKRHSVFDRWELSINLLSGYLSLNTQGYSVVDEIIRIWMINGQDIPGLDEFLLKLVSHNIDHSGMAMPFPVMMSAVVFLIRVNAVKAYLETVNRKARLEREKVNTPFSLTSSTNFPVQMDIDYYGVRDIEGIVRSAMRYYPAAVIEAEWNAFLEYWNGKLNAQNTMIYGKLLSYDDWAVYIQQCGAISSVTAEVEFLVWYEQSFLTRLWNNFFSPFTTDVEELNPLYERPFGPATRACDSAMQILVRVNQSRKPGETLRSALKHLHQGEKKRFLYAMNRIIDLGMNLNMQQAAMSLGRLHSVTRQFMERCFKSTVESASLYDAFIDLFDSGVPDVRDILMNCLSVINGICGQLDMAGLSKEYPQPMSPPQGLDMALYVMRVTQSSRPTQSASNYGTNVVDQRMASALLSAMSMMPVDHEETALFFSLLEFHLLPQFATAFQLNEDAIVFYLTQAKSDTAKNVISHFFLSAYASGKFSDPLNSFTSLYKRLEKESVMPSSSSLVGVYEEKSYDDEFTVGRLAATYELSRLAVPFEGMERALYFPTAAKESRNLLQVVATAETLMRDTLTKLVPTTMIVAEMAKPDGFLFIKPVVLVSPHVPKRTWMSQLMAVVYASQGATVVDIIDPLTKMTVNRSQLTSRLVSEKEIFVFQIAELDGFYAAVYPRGAAYPVLYALDVNKSVELKLPIIPSTSENKGIIESMGMGYDVETNGVVSLIFNVLFISEYTNEASFVKYTRESYQILFFNENGFVRPDIKSLVFERREGGNVVQERVPDLQKQSRLFPNATIARRGPHTFLVQDGVLMNTRYNLYGIMREAVYTEPFSEAGAADFLNGKTLNVTRFSEHVVWFTESHVHILGTSETGRYEKISLRAAGVPERVTEVTPTGHGTLDFGDSEKGWNQRAFNVRTAGQQHFLVVVTKETDVHVVPFKSTSKQVNWWSGLFDVNTDNRRILVTTNYLHFSEVVDADNKKNRMKFEFILAQLYMKMCQISLDAFLSGRERTINVPPVLQIHLRSEKVDDFPSYKQVVELMKQSVDNIPDLRPSEYVNWRRYKIPRFTLTSGKGGTLEFLMREPLGYQQNLRFVHVQMSVDNQYTVSIHDVTSGVIAKNYDNPRIGRRKTTSTDPFKFTPKDFMPFRLELVNQDGNMTLANIKPHALIPSGPTTNSERAFSVVIKEQRPKKRRRDIDTDRLRQVLQTPLTYQYQKDLLERYPFDLYGVEAQNDPYTDRPAEPVTLTERAVKFLDDYRDQVDVENRKRAITGQRLMRLPGDMEKYLMYDPSKKVPNMQRRKEMREALAREFMRRVYDENKYPQFQTFENALLSDEQRALLPPTPPPAEEDDDEEEEREEGELSEDSSSVTYVDTTPVPLSPGTPTTVDVLQQEESEEIARPLKSPDEDAITASGRMGMEDAVRARVPTPREEEYLEMPLDQPVLPPPSPETMETDVVDGEEAQELAAVPVEKTDARELYDEDTDVFDVYGESDGSPRASPAEENEEDLDLENALDEVAETLEEEKKKVATVPRDETRRLAQNLTEPVTKERMTIKEQTALRIAKQQERQKLERLAREKALQQEDLAIAQENERRKLAGEPLLLTRQQKLQIQQEEERRAEEARKEEAARRKKERDEEVRKVNQRKNYERKVFRRIMSGDTKNASEEAVKTTYDALKETEVAVSEHKKDRPQGYTELMHSKEDLKITREAIVEFRSLMENKRKKKESLSREENERGKRILARAKHLEAEIAKQLAQNDDLRRFTEKETTLEDALARHQKAFNEAMAARGLNTDYVFKSTANPGQVGMVEEKPGSQDEMRKAVQFFEEQSAVLQMDASRSQIFVSSHNASVDDTENIFEAVFQDQVLKAKKQLVPHNDLVHSLETEGKASVFRVHLLGRDYPNYSTSPFFRTRAQEYALVEMEDATSSSVNVVSPFSRKEREWTVEHLPTQTHNLFFRVDAFPNSLFVGVPMRSTLQLKVASADDSFDDFPPVGSGIIFSLIFNDSQGQVWSAVANDTKMRVQLYKMNGEKSVVPDESVFREVEARGKFKSFDGTLVDYSEKGSEIVCIDTAGQVCKHRVPNEALDATYFSFTENWVLWFKGRDILIQLRGEDRIHKVDLNQPMRRVVPTTHFQMDTADSLGRYGTRSFILQSEDGKNNYFLWINSVKSVMMVPTDSFPDGDVLFNGQLSVYQKEKKVAFVWQSMEWERHPLFSFYRIVPSIMRAAVDEVLFDIVCSPPFPQLLRDEIWKIDRFTMPTFESGKAKLALTDRFLGVDSYSMKADIVFQFLFQMNDNQSELLYLVQNEDPLDAHTSMLLAVDVEDESVPDTTEYSAFVGDQRRLPPTDSKRTIEKYPAPVPSGKSYQGEFDFDQREEMSIPLDSMDFYDTPTAPPYNPFTTPSRKRKLDETRLRK